MDIRDMIGGLFSHRRMAKPIELSKYTVQHTHRDEYRHDNLYERSEIFRETIDTCPEFEIAKDDGTVVRKRVEAADGMNGDLFFALHTDDIVPNLLPSEKIRPSRELAKQIAEGVINSEHFPAIHSRTSGDDIASAFTLVEMTETRDRLLRELLEEEMRRAEEMREQEEIIDNPLPPDFPQGDPMDGDPNGVPGDIPVNVAPGPQGSGAGGRGVAPGGSGAGGKGIGTEAGEHGFGPNMTPERWEALQTAARRRREARQRLADLAAEQQAQGGLGTQVKDAIDQIAERGKEATDAFMNMPGIEAGMHDYSEDPDATIEMAKRWLDHPNAAEVLSRLGRMERNFRFVHSNRAPSGREIPVDVELGDDIANMLIGELTDAAMPETRPLFYQRYMDKALLQFEMQGEAESGKGPIVILIDFSGSMGGENHIWAKTTALASLVICERENRPLTIIAFDTRVMGMWTFAAGEKPNLQRALEFVTMQPAGGTQPLPAMQRAESVMQGGNFKQADILIITDGECGYGEEDLALKARLEAQGVRIFGVLIDEYGGDEPTEYLATMCQQTVNVQDMAGPNEATEMLVQTII